MNHPKPVVSCTLDAVVGSTGERLQGAGLRTPPWLRPKATGKAQRGTGEAVRIGMVDQGDGEAFCCW